MKASWELRKRSAADADDPALVVVIRDLFRECFGSDGWSDLGIRHRLVSASVLALLRDERGTPRGYALYEVPEPTLRGARVLWESSVAVAPALQGQGFSTSVLRSIFAAPALGPFGWLAGRTQNPVVVRRYGAFGKLFPFELDYSAEEGPELLSYLRQRISDLEHAGSIEPTTGICRRAYREGRLGGYSPPDPRDAREQKLAAWGFSRDQGDAIVVAARLSR